MTANRTTTDGGEARQRDDSPILLNVREVARLLGIGERSVWRLVGSRRLPKPISLGRSKRWSRRGMEQYVDAASKAANRGRT